MNEYEDQLEASINPFVACVDLVADGSGPLGPRVNLALQRRDVRLRLNEVIRREIAPSFCANVIQDELIYRFKKEWLTPMLETARREALIKRPISDATLRLDAVQELFMRSPAGLYFDEQKAQLIILGSILGLGRAWYLYRTRSGDNEGSHLAKLSTNLIPHFQLGNLDLNAEIKEFLPTQRTIKLETRAATDHWRPIETKVEIKGGIENHRLSPVEGSAGMVIPLGRSKLSLDLDFNKDRLSSVKTGVSGPLGPGLTGKGFLTGNNKGLTKLELGLTWSDGNKSLSGSVIGSTGESAKFDYGLGLKLDFKLP
jgi:hypothetical protein